MHRVAWSALLALMGAQGGTAASASSARPAPPPVAASVAAPPGAAADSGRELVVVSHGLGRTRWSMRPLVKALEAAGYDVMPFGYSSYCCEIAEIGQKLQRALDARMTPQHTKVHFVGHSLGNIVHRWVLTRDTVPARVGRVVMLAPPNQGAHAANVFTPWVGWLLRPIAELRADSGTTVRSLPPLRVGEVGVIVGRDDRTVKAHESHLAEERGHTVVAGGHTFIMRRREVHALTIRFLRTGQFAESAAPGVADPPL